MSSRFRQKAEPGVVMNPNANERKGLTLGRARDDNILMTTTMNRCVRLEKKGQGSKRKTKLAGSGTIVIRAGGKPENVEKCWFLWLPAKSANSCQGAPFAHKAIKLLPVRIQLCATTIRSSNGIIIIHVTDWNNDISQQQQIGTSQVP